MNATCRQCLSTFETERTDSIFCSAACRASYYRAFGDADVHADLNRTKSKFCEYCGNLFWFNDYADRKGKRVPTYCKDSCRVAAFRKRAKDTKAHDHTAHSDPSPWEAYRQHSAPPPPPKHESGQHSAPPRTGDFRDDLKPPSRWTGSDAYIWLGVAYGTDEQTCRKAYRSIMLQHHPDRNGGTDWSHTKHVNAAWDYLKKMWKHGF